MTAAEKDLELRDYLRILWRRKLVVALAVVLVTGAALATALLQTKVYRGTAEVLLQPRSTEFLFDVNQIPVVDRNRAAATEIRILQSQPVREEVAKQLGKAPPVSANQAGQTDIIQVSAESTDPAQAATIANTYATAYIQFRRNQAVDDILAASTQIQTKINELQVQVDQATGPQRDSLQQAQTVFRQKLDQLQVDQALKTGGAQLVTPAIEPTVPVKPRPIRSGVTGLGIGLMLGFALAFLTNYLDDSVKTKDDLERSSGVGTIGLIPAVDGWKNKTEAHVVSLDEPTSPAAEAYRALRTSIQFLALDRPMRALEVTSPNAGEGKTTTLANLGVVLARAGQRVVLVCCDLRRPRIHEFFGLTNAVGFTSVLLGRASTWEAIQKVPDVDRLFVLASGPLPPNPSELLMSKRTTEVLASLTNEGYVVLIDAPPVLPVTDAAVLSRSVDATLLVTLAGQTSKKEAARAVEVLGHVNAPLVGTVLNGVSAEGSYGYDYRYRYDARTPAKAAPVKVKK